MKVSEAITLIKGSTLQNISDDRDQGSGWVTTVNTALGFIFAYMLNKGSWFFATKTETLTPISGNTFQTTYDIASIYSVTDVNGGSIYEAPISFEIPSDMDPQDENEKGIMRVSGTTNQIITLTNTSSIKITYARFPKTHIFGQQQQEDLDLPIQLLFALQAISNRCIMPIHLEQGASLSNNYFNQARTFMDEYASAIGVKQIGFTA